MKTRIIEIFNELKETRKELGYNNLSISDTILFQESCTFLRGELAQQGKVKREVKKATDKQLAYIQKLADKKKKNIKLDSNMTSLEASKLIEELQ